MKAGEVFINDIFNGAKLIEVPFYQRSYVWKEDQWERFLTDMEYVSDTKRSYFLGSIILKNGEIPNMSDAFSIRKIIIDGQQRLTTLILFFKALCLKAGCNGKFDHDFRFIDGTIAMQHGRNDCEAFKLVTDQEEPIEVPNSTPPSAIITAYNYFLKKADPNRINLNIIKQNVQFVCVDLAHGEDEQQVFDTINSLGVRLTTAELLKNYFYSRDNVQEYENNWVEIFEKDSECKQYWDQEVETGRIRRSLIDIFFDAYFQIFVQSKVFSVSSEDKIAYARIDHLAQSYQDFVDKYCNKNKSVILEHMAEYAKCFAENFRLDYCERGIPGSRGIERMNVIMFGLKTTTLIPYVLYVAKEVQDQSKRNEIYDILENYIMRRIVVRATTKNYNNLFTSLILNNVLDAQSLKERLNRSGEITTFVPNDDELLRGFIESKLVNLQSKGILYMMESAIRPANSATVLLGFNGYSLEHLMPKKWRNNWPACATEELAQQRDSTLLTMGNLAIIPQSLNTSIRDGDWYTKKRGKGNSNPGLDICAGGICTIHDVLQKPVWNEEEIKNRAKWLFEQAKQIWKI